MMNWRDELADNEQPYVDFLMSSHWGDPLSKKSLLEKKMAYLLDAREARIAELEKRLAEFEAMLDKELGYEMEK